MGPLSGAFFIIIVLLSGVAAASSSSNSGLNQKRSLTRFTLGHPDNDLCWDREGEDGFFSVVDTHNHFKPFGGPSVEFDVYLDWMMSHGILFSTMFGIGQLIMKSDPQSPDCCYYLHCPTFQYQVVPDPTNDRLNAEDYVRYREDANLTSQIHLLPSLTFPNLQNPETNMANLKDLQDDFPGVFGWAGEINVFKHALAGNGFFANGKRVTVRQVDSGAYDELFAAMEKDSIPVTLHCDLGCDNYDALTFSTPLPIKMCETPQVELVAAAREHMWWKDMLGVHYHGFFDKNDQPRTANFKKIMHLRVWDTILSRYPNVNIIWAHVGLSKELKNLHPIVHMHVLTTLFERHDNLYTDVSWDVLPKQLLMNFKNQSVARLMHTSHEDFHHNAAHLFNKTAIYELRTELHNDIWMQHKDTVHATGSAAVIGGPTYSMAIYLDVLNTFSDRFLTGTDFVASNGQPSQYPGLRDFKYPPSGCLKDQANHARQLTDTSSMNMFLDDAAFSNIVLGGNYFRLTGLDSQFGPPPVCGAETGLSGTALGLIIGGVIVAVLILIAIIIAVLKCRN